MPPVRFPAPHARGECDVTPSRPRIFGVGSSNRTRIRASFLARIALRKKRDVPRAAAWPVVKWGLATVGRGHYVPRVTDAREAVRVSQSFVQLIGYVVLAAIILATGFGAV